LVDLFDVRERVHFRGRLTDEELSEEYRRAALFALPGRCRLTPEPEGEGFGIVFLEASLAGLPVIAGNGCGAAEAVQDGITGRLVDPNEPADVAAAVTDLLSDRATASTMGRAGREWVSTRHSVAGFQEATASLALELQRGSA
jgi:phosphatidylinositol alpha-1,6-mannosyltransferase